MFQHACWHCVEKAGSWIHVKVFNIIWLLIMHTHKMTKEMQSFPTANSLAAPACHWKAAQACHQTRKKQCPIFCWPAPKDSCWQSSVTSRQSQKPIRLFLDSTIPSSWEHISRLNERYKRNEPTDASSTWHIKSFSLLLAPYCTRSLRNPKGKYFTLRERTWGRISRASFPRICD